MGQDPENKISGPLFVFERIKSVGITLHGIDFGTGLSEQDTETCGG